MRAIRPFLILLLFVALAIPAAAEDWTRFRGSNGAGMSDSKGLPAEFGPDKNKVWEADVPFGRSSPVIAGDHIYLTATDDGKFVTMALFLSPAIGYGFFVEFLDAAIVSLWGITLVVSIMHFWYDGFVWSVQKKQV